MLSPTLQEGLEAYGIGAKVRTLRLKKKMGLVELGRHTGLSPAMLSKIERGQLFPTLPTLLRIALVFSVGLDHFFAGARTKPVVGVVRPKDRMRFPERPETEDVAYEFESLDFPATERRLNAFYAEFQAVPDERLRAHQHSGGEFIYVLTGLLSVRIEDEEHALAAGDSIYFDSSVPHSYRRRGPRACTAIVVTPA
jgi:transcriptional regulator with XRE-family HTH domain